MKPRNPGNKQAMNAYKQRIQNFLDTLPDNSTPKDFLPSIAKYMIPTTLSDSRKRELLRFAIGEET